MVRLHWTTFSPRPYHVLKIPERGEDGVKMKQFRISKFPLRPYYVPATSLSRPHQVLTTSFTFPLRPQYGLTPSSSRFHYVLATSSQRPSSSYHARTTFPARSNCKYINQSYMLSSTPLVVGRNAHTEAFFQLIAKGAPNKILSFYFSVPVHQVRHDVLEGEQVARVLLCSCFDSDMI